MIVGSTRVALLNLVKEEEWPPRRMGRSSSEFGSASSAYPGGASLKKDRASSVVTGSRTTGARRVVSDQTRAS